MIAERSWPAPCLPRGSVQIPGLCPDLGTLCPLHAQGKGSGRRGPGRAQRPPEPPPEGRSLLCGAQGTAGHGLPPLPTCVSGPWPSWSGEQHSLIRSSIKKGVQPSFRKSSAVAGRLSFQGLLAVRRLTQELKVRGKGSNWRRGWEQGLGPSELGRGLQRASSTSSYPFSGCGN